MSIIQKIIWTRAEPSRHQPVLNHSRCFNDVDWVGNVLIWSKQSHSWRILEYPGFAITSIVQSYSLDYEAFVSNIPLLTAWQRRHLKFKLLRKFQKFFYHNHAHCFLNIFSKSDQNILVLNCGLTSMQRKVQGPWWLILCHVYPNQSAKEYWLICLVRSCSTSRP